VLERLPPLRSLRVIEALWKHGSVTAAARELNVSHSAISHQLKQIEEWSGVHLVMRDGRRTILTEAGESLARVAHDCFGAMRHEMDRLTMRERMPVTVAALPLVTANWLMPVAQDFMRTHPAVSIYLLDMLSDQPASPAPDISVAFSLDGDMPSDAAKLIPGHAVPVCAPAYLRRHSLRQTRDLRTARLIHDEDSRMWPAWFAAAGVDAPPEQDEGRLYLAGSDMLCDAALSGSGVALCREALIAGHIQEKRLVKVSDVRIDDSACYYMQLSSGGKRKGLVTLLAETLMSVARRDFAAAG